jgi:hypothetical protein
MHLEVLSANTAEEIVVQLVVEVLSMECVKDVTKTEVTTNKTYEYILFR